MPPQAENCDCIYDFIMAILDKKPNQFYHDSCADNQQERCQLSACDVVRNFRISPKENLHDGQSLSSFDESTGNGTGSSNLNNDDIVKTHPLPTYVHRYPPIHHQSPTNNKPDHHTGSSDIDMKVIIQNIIIFSLFSFQRAKKPYLFCFYRIPIHQHLKRINPLIPTQYYQMSMTIL